MAQKKEIPNHVKDYFREFGREGGKKAASRMSKEQRRARAMKGVEARLKKGKGDKKK